MNHARLWDPRPWNIIPTVIALAAISFIFENIIEYSLDIFLEKIGIPSNIKYIKEIQSNSSWVSPLIISPVLENLICLFWIRTFFLDEKWRWWKGALIVSLIAGAFHALFYWELRYLAITIDFFFICCFMLNSANKVKGYWISVFFHSLVNVFVFIDLKFA